MLNGSRIGGLAIASALFGAFALGGCGGGDVAEAPVDAQRLGLSESAPLDSHASIAAACDQADAAAPDSFGARGGYGATNCNAGTYSILDAGADDAVPDAPPLADDQPLFAATPAAVAEKAL